MTCPTCGSHDISKNGTTHRGKQNYKCRDCERQFVDNPQWQPKPKETKTLVNRLLHEKIPLAGIARAARVSQSWLQAHANAVYAAVPQTAEVLPKPEGSLRVQMDELWSFVGHKGNKQWVWLAMDAETREILGCHIGDRSRESAMALWQSIPAVYRQCAKVYTDFWEAYVTVIPSKQHEAVGKDSGLTSYIERLNNTLRQRVSRLVRKTLSFSKKIENHSGAIWLFIHDYNRQIRQKLAEQGHPVFSSALH
ncbi:IS1 family transposase [Nodosilinea sp. LEGE 07298]|uniref:IS1 family transposase n=1 Tax=Nodosilinea sp. LEGE 07298 TaxID=2777970 RepID=UPI00187F9618|nr:IS1 family transposase [Nodosilinea sp. LEGE 07298]MBE9108404.1 IS1 family transposase [Nodosilinea sp. LEGE 07298]